MKKILGTKKTVPLVAIIILLSFITLFLIVEFRFLKETIGEYETGIQRIASSKTTGYINDLKFITERWARELERQTDSTETLKKIPRSDNRVTGVYLVNKNGNIVNSVSFENKMSFKNEFPGILHQKAIKEGNAFVFASQGHYSTDSLFTAAPMIMENRLNSGSESGFTGFIILEFTINEFKKEIFQEFIQPNYKVAIFDQDGQAVIWPFTSHELEQFDSRRVNFKSENIRYEINKSALPGTSLFLYFFDKEENFDTFRILTIMFLLFALYFLIYQFLVELWQANSTRSYFENIDFDILNHLREGIIIANKVNRIIFANKSAHDLLPEKQIIFKESNLKEMLGQIGESNKKFTLKKLGQSLEIIRSPIFKNGKMLGSLVVISESIESEKLCALTFAKLIELLKDGIIFVGQDSKIHMVNMMAQYHLGKIEKGTDISDVNPDLAAAVYKHIGSHSVQRITLPVRKIVAEMTNVYFHNGSYAGTLVILKVPQDYEK